MSASSFRFSTSSLAMTKNKNPLQTSVRKGFYVPRPGLEPGWVTPLVFETSASTDSAIWASKAGAKIRISKQITK